MPPLRLMFVFGTRPEAIKLAPLILQAKARADGFATRVVVTAQHRQMLDDVLRVFEIVPDADLNIMAPGQSLFHITSQVFAQLERELNAWRADVVIVQGDTTTTFAAAVAGYYARAKVAHIEAGLRTGDKWAPFPEEINRRLATATADLHFAPTASARDNLLRENIPAERIHVTGNTVIDALLWMDRRLAETGPPDARLAHLIERHPRWVLITGHRRESFGAPLERICDALAELARRHPEIGFIYPVHLNPNVQQPVHARLGALRNFHLIEPLAYAPFVWLMRRAHLIVTDSGGIQEEAPALGKPVLVTRRVTERPEAVEAGLARLVGDDPQAIVTEAERLLSDETAYAAMAAGGSPYGDGHACERILQVLQEQ